MFTTFNASESRSLRKRQGAVVADILNDQPATPDLSESVLYSSFHALEKASLASVSSKSISSNSSGMMGSMTRAMSTLSTKTLSIFQRKRIPEFTAPETHVVIIQNEVPRIIITPADDNLFSSEDSTEPFPNASPTPAQSFADVSQLVSEEPLDGMDSPITSEDGHSSASSSTPSSGPSTPPQHPKDIPYVKPENRHFISNTAALWSTRHGQSYRKRHNKVVVPETADNKIQKDSLDTLESTEIDLMFQRESGNSDFVEAYRGRRWAQLENSEDNWSVDTGSEGLALSVEFDAIYTAILRAYTADHSLFMTSGFPATHYDPQLGHCMMGYILAAHTLYAPPLFNEP